MTCSRTDIRELIALRMEGTLNENDLLRLERHLAACPECAAEYRLLRVVADEPVPDPGDLFWETLPDRVHRELTLRQHRRTPFPILSFLRGMLRPGWRWATAAAAAMVLLAVWLSVRPVPQEAHHSSARQRTVPAVDIIQEAANTDAVRPEQLERLSAWAHNELLSLQRDAADLSANGNGPVTGMSMNVDIEDALTSLSEDQLETLIDTMDQQVQDGEDEET